MESTTGRKYQHFVSRAPRVAAAWRMPSPSLIRWSLIVQAAVIRFLKPQLPPVSAIERYFARSRESGRFSNGGPCHRELAERAAAYIGGGVTAVPVANGTLGLMLALRAVAGQPHRDRSEVIVPSFTFAATASAIVWTGYVPVFADVDIANWHLAPPALEQALAIRGERVAAVIACSTFGSAPPRATTLAWERIARDRGIPLVVDSAAGFGSIDEDGNPLGRQGAAELFSFHATKPLAVGEGGLVTTRDPSVAARIAELSNFGFDSKHVVAREPGINAKLDEWHAATALAALDQLGDVLAARRGHVAAMREALVGRGWTFQSGSESAAGQFLPVLADRPAVRELVLAAARARSIELRTYFDPPLHGMPGFAAHAVGGSLETTDALAARILSLPMANDLSDESRKAIVACLRSPTPDRTLAGEKGMR
jgi:dTDP-4-amino-4,6-dideoxygalactose transaminase